MERWTQAFLLVRSDEPGPTSERARPSGVAEPDVRSHLLRHREEQTCFPVPSRLERQSHCGTAQWTAQQ